MGIHDIMYHNDIMYHISKQLADFVNSWFTMRFNKQRSKWLYELILVTISSPILRDTKLPKSGRHC